MADLSHDRLRALLIYDPETGEFTWRADHNDGRQKAGHRAGSDLKRYRKLWIDGQQYLAHRVACFWMTGEWPASQIDHRDQDGFNNRWANLREATGSQNSMNRGAPANNTSGFKGVTFIKNTAKCGRKPWKATIQKDGKRRLIGLFGTAEEAGAAYRAATVEVHGEFARVA